MSEIEYLLAPTSRQSRGIVIFRTLDQVLRLELLGNTKVKDTHIPTDVDPDILRLNVTIFILQVDQKITC
jgi:hypothetical protein